jgi:16S rRNA (guanine966-N2)-methyltransferase
MVERGWVRIIGGQWRGKKLKVPDIADLRPTPDRIRETLFNWLAPNLQGAYCLDLFAGSGALGFEALSRGAGFVVLVDQSPAVVKVLREESKQLKAENVEIYQANAPKIKFPQKLFDIVFLDPPFQKNLLLSSCFYLEENSLLAEHAHIYLEAKESLDEAALPGNWRLLKSKKAGQVAYHLARRT